MTIETYHVPANADGSKTVEVAAYVTLAQTDDILAADITRRDAWIAAGEAQKAVALVTASRRLDFENFVGERTSSDYSTQQLAWPRSGVPGVEDNEIPRAIEEACALLAGSLLLDSSKATGEAESNIRAVGAGEARVEFFKPSYSSLSLNKTWPDVFRLIRPYLKTGSLERGLASGVNGASEFSGERYGLIGGWS